MLRISGLDSRGCPGTVGLRSSDKQRCEAQTDMHADDPAGRLVRPSHWDHRCRSQLEDTA